MSEPKRQTHKQAEDSFVQRLKALPIGGVESRSSRLEHPRTTVADIRSELQRLQNSVSPAIRRARKDVDGASYACTAGHFATRDGDVIATLAVTRTA